MALIVTPNTGQNLNQTLIPIQTNFGTIDTAFAVNHIDYGTTGQGKHILVTMPVNASPTPTLSGEMSLFTQLVSGTPQMFIQQQTGGAVINFTQYINTAGVDISTTLPSGLKIKFGTATTPGGGSKTVAFTTPFTTVLAAYATISDTAGSNSSSNDNVARIYAYSTTSISVVTYFENTARTRVSDTFSWLVIGT